MRVYWESTQSLQTDTAEIDLRIPTDEIDQHTAGGGKLAVEGVFHAVAHHKQIGRSVAQEGILARPADELVGAAAAAKRIVPGAAGEEVGGGIADNPMVANAADDVSDVVPPCSLRQYCFDTREIRWIVVIR